MRGRKKFSSIVLSVSLSISCCFIVTLPPSLLLPCIFCAPTPQTTYRPSTLLRLKMGKWDLKKTNTRKNIQRAVQHLALQYVPTKISKRSFKLNMSKADAKDLAINFVSQHKVNSVGPHDVNQIV